MLTALPFYASAEQTQAVGNQGYIFGTPPVKTTQTSTEDPAHKKSVPNLFKAINQLDQWIEKKLW